MRPFLLLAVLTITIGICPVAATAQDTPKPQTQSVNDQRTLTEQAEKGNARAQYNLGVMYHTGQGVPQDNSEAVKWFRKAGDQGEAHAQFAPGLIYEQGQGVPQDNSEAVKWF